MSKRERDFFDLLKKSKPGGELRMTYGQSKKHSFAESIVNVLVGFAISTAANLIVLPWFGYNVNLSGAIGIGGVLTIVSVLRSYALRRVFNWYHVWQQEQRGIHAKRI